MKTHSFNKGHLKKVREAKGLGKSELILQLHDAGLTLSRPTYDQYEETGDNLEVKDLELISKVLGEPLENFFCS